MSENKVKWYQYPEKKPPKKDVYLVTVVDKIPFVVEAEYLYEKKKFFDIYMGDVFNDCVVAWAEMPEPYEEKEE